MASKTGGLARRARRQRSRAKGSAGSTGRATQKASGRYTPPIPRQKKVSPLWVPVLMFALLIVGVLSIILNYISVIPGSPSNWYLIAGIIMIFVGFLTATSYR